MQDCNCCHVLQSIIDREGGTLGKMIIWHQTGQSDVVQITVMRDGTDHVAASGSTICQAINDLELRMSE